MKILFQQHLSHPYHLARLSSLRDITSYFQCQLISLDLYASSTKYTWLKPSKGNTHDFSADHISLNLPAGVSSRLIRVFQLYKLLLLLRKVSPDILFLSGWGAPDSIISLLWAKIHMKKVVLLSDSQQDDYPRNPISEYIKRLILCMPDHFFVAGKPHSDYITTLGVNEDRISLGCDVVDNDFFVSPYPRQLESNTILTIARLADSKNLLKALDAFESFSQCYPTEEWSWHIYGDGPLYHDLLRKSSNLECNVTFYGAVTYEELPSVYCKYSVFFLPSSIEQWGLVVNEACASGMPVLLSERCGSVCSLVDNTNGWTFNPFSTQSILLSLHQMRADKHLWPYYSQNSKLKVKQHSLSVYSEQVKTIIVRLLSK